MKDILNGTSYSIGHVSIWSGLQMKNMFEVCAHTVVEGGLIATDRDINKEKQEYMEQNGIDIDSHSMDSPLPPSVGNNNTTTTNNNVTTNSNAPGLINQNQTTTRFVKINTQNIDYKNNYNTRINNDKPALTESQFKKWISTIDQDGFIKNLEINMEKYK